MKYELDLLSPWINEDDIRSVVTTLQSTFVTESTVTAELEEKAASLVGVDGCIAFANGTVALAAGIMALELPHGSMIAVPDITFAATANAVILAGHTPVFVDIELDTHFISLQSLTVISAEVNIAAVIAVNLYGGTGQLLKLKNWCTEKDIILIEDNAQGLGSKLDTRALGSFGHFSITSLYGNKTITSGEGGLLFSNDQDLLKRSYSLKNHGRDKKGTFIHDSIGYNFCYSDLQASLAISQIDKIRKISEKKKKIYDTYNDIFKDSNYIEILQFHKNVKACHWVSVINFMNKEVCEIAKNWLNENNVPYRLIFYPLHMQPCYQNTDKVKFDIQKYMYANAEFAYQTSLCLPSGYSSKIADVQAMANDLKNYIV